jgi:DNA-binding CsgD family transcriptional regulator
MLEVLSKREKDVLICLAQGLDDRQTAEKLGIAAPTVKNHIHRILRKLHVKSRTQAVAALYRQAGVLPEQVISCL